MQIRKQIGVVVLMALLAVTLACTPQDAAFQTNRTVTAISSANLAMASSVIQLNNLGKVDNELTNQILTYNRDVATSVKAAEVILKSGKQWNVIAPEVLKLLRDIQLPANVAAFIDHPAVDVGVQGLVAIIQTVELLIKQSLVEVQK